MGPVVAPIRAATTIAIPFSEEGGALHSRSPGSVAEKAFRSRRIIRTACATCLRDQATEGAAL